MTIAPADNLDVAEPGKREANRDAVRANERVRYDRAPFPRLSAYGGSCQNPSRMRV